LLEKIISNENLNEAFKRVKKNKGSYGIDKMGVDELLPYLKRHGEELKQSIANRSYKPNLVRRVEIPKDNGKTRPLGIGKVVNGSAEDRANIVGQAVFEIGSWFVGTGPAKAGAMQEKHLKQQKWLQKQRRQLRQPKQYLPQRKQYQKQERIYLV
jgi:hypothetical protein